MKCSLGLSLTFCWVEGLQLRLVGHCLGEEEPAVLLIDALVVSLNGICLALGRLGLLGLLLLFGLRQLWLRRPVRVTGVKGCFLPDGGCLDEILTRTMVALVITY